MKMNRIWTAAIGGAVLTIALSACGASSDTTRNAAAIPELPECSSDVMADTQAAVVDITRDLIAEQRIPVGWDGKGQLADNEPAVLAAAKAAMLPCIPVIDIDNPAANPPNVQALQSVVPLELWSQVVLPNKVGAGEGSAPRPEGFADPADSYRAFLTVAARFPYFCGEEGVWDSVKEACQREFSTIFAHAIQETGEKPVPADEQVWQTSLFYTREITCYPNNCPSYNAGAEAFDPPSDVGYYGRGMKQLSYAYNYAAFSATYFGDMRVLIDNPDLVATDPHLLLGSGVWFAMSPQPPKPSMHDVMTGIYQPADLPAQGFEGITTQGNGSVFNKFDTTVSIINGAVECSPLDGSGKPEEKEVNVQRSKNRFINFKALLPVVGVPESEQTKYEKEIIPGQTYCLITNGNPFKDQLDGRYPLAWQIPFYLDAGNLLQVPPVYGTCIAVGYGQAVPLPVSAPGMYQLCLDKYAKPQPTTSPSPSGSTSPTSDPSPTGSASPTASPGADEVSADYEGFTVTLKKTGAGWDGGYCANLSGHNDGGDISTWTVSFTLPAGATVDQPWTGMIKGQNANRYSWLPGPSNAAVAEDGQLAPIGTCFYGTNDMPSQFRVITSP